MKLCKDCKYCLSQFPTWTVAMCVHPDAPVDPVYGNKDASCALMRSPNCLVDPACGADAKWFEEAPPKPAFEPKNYVPIQVEPEQPSFWRRIFG